MSFKAEVVPEMLGPYRCLRKLAVGGMGEVYLAEARGASGFSKRLVIKSVRPDREEEQEVIQAFLDEARVWALLTHPNIVPLYDCLWLEGRLCLVMEYVEGADLRELIQSAQQLHRPVPGAIAVQLVAQVAAALHAAHEARGRDGEPLGVVHRDVSPHNVLVDRGGNARLCDFGIARSALRMTRTRTGKFKGKFAYVSPEAIRGESVDRRADIFGLGVLLFELLALERPFQAEAPVALLRAILDNDPPPIRDVRREVSVRIAHVIERALSKEASARFPTAEAMRQALLETPEGQTFLSVTRLTEWFDSLTGVTTDWNATQSLLLDLASSAASRSIEDEELEPVAQPPLQPLVPPLVQPGLEQPPPSPLDATVAPEATVALPRISEPCDDPTVVTEQPPPPLPPFTRESTTEADSSRILIPPPTVPARPRPIAPPPAALPPRAVPPPAPPAARVAPAPAPPPKKPNVVVEFWPWALAGLAVGAFATWLMWRLG